MPVRGAPFVFSTDPAIKKSAMYNNAYMPVRGAPLSFPIWRSFPGAMKLFLDTQVSLATSLEKRRVKLAPGSADRTVESRLEKMKL